MAFADSGRADEEHVAGFGHEPAGRQLIDPVARNGRVEAEIKSVQAARFAEISALDAAGHGAPLAHGQFVSRMTGNLLHALVEQAHHPPIPAHPHPPPDELRRGLVIRLVP